MKFLLFFGPALVSLAHTVLAATGQDSVSLLRDEIAASPTSAPTAVVRTLRGAGPEVATLAGPVTAAAIESLGAKPGIRKISAVVYAAVRTVPNSVLEIVHAAVTSAPYAASEIAASAASAVPNPWKEVRYHRPGTLTGVPAFSSTAGHAIRRGERDFKGEPDFKGAVDAAVDPGDPMSLAEAIVQEAFNSQTEIGLAAIQGAVDGALIGDPGKFVVADPRGISGVGEFGNSNFENEPHFPNPPPTPPAPPRAPAVSQ